MTTYEHTPTGHRPAPDLGAFYVVIDILAMAVLLAAWVYVALN